MTERNIIGKELSMSWLSQTIRNSPEVRELVDTERRKHEAAMKRDAGAWESFVRAAGMLTTRMVIEGHWIRRT